jgi:hypothetical protein
LDVRSKLRSKIIGFYIAAKAMVDSLQTYEGLNASHATSEQQIIQYSGQLKRMSAEYSELYIALRHELDRYLSATPPTARG